MGNAAPPIKRLREELHCECHVGSVIASAVPYEGVCVKRREGMRHTARLTMAQLLVPVLVLLCMSTPGSSSDAKGNYVALGFGLESCQTFLQARGSSPDLPYRFAAL
jgi:hypothetical protein